ncbi:LRR domain containing protein [Trema orientale]|uniref:LRR domain containing protein n=1 Tax=Trema orientale TaxID=63057 RepID=A0A2P5BLP7_TREOI|nr:LRR domain containing protein [Trema orientale]
MHDLVHDLAIFVSGEVSFRLDLSNDLHSLSDNTRHLSFRKDTCDLGKLKVLCKAKCLRTFVALPLDKLYEPDCSKYPVPYDLLLSTGSCLRVLSLSQSSIQELPDSISHLKHLRYLDLSYTEIRELPDSICTLYNLQTLLLSRCGNLSRLPKNMGSLMNLRHLDIEGVPLKEMPPQITNMKYLRTLSHVVLGYGQSGFKIKMLNEFEHLHGKLGILGLENIVDAAEASEGNLTNRNSLSKIYFRWNANAGAAESSQKEKEVLDALRPHTNLTELEIEFYRGTIFSNWLVDHSFSNLVSVCLRDCKYCWALPPLGQLPSLKELIIGGFDSVVSIGDEIHGSGTSFSSLEVIYIGDMLEWKEWSFSEAILEVGIFPRLTFLVFYNCPKLVVGLPGYLPSLKELHINDCEQMEVLLFRNQQSVTASSSLNSKLKSLVLKRCKTLFKNSMNWDLQRHPCLETLNIIEWEDESFPDEGLLPTTLTDISIQHSSKLEGLNGKAFQQLTSLKSLYIHVCQSLRCLPEEGLPTSLEDLTIAYCPLLKQRCEEGGEDWPKISHIPSLRLKNI